MRANDSAMMFKDSGQSAGVAEVLKLDNQLCFALYALSRKVTALYRPLLEPLGITYPQYLVFLAMWEIQSGISPEYFVGVPIKTLCKRLQLDTGTLTPLLKRLESDGWLTRERSRDDEREVLIKLAEKGLTLRQQALSIPGALVCQVGGDWAELLEIQHKLSNLLRRLSPED